jgi:hypothetical protein
MRRTVAALLLASYFVVWLFKPLRRLDNKDFN